MELFKAYDIRGKYGAGGINPELAYKVGKAFARFQGGEAYLVGHDARTHSRELYEAAIRGLLSEGKRVVGIGLVSTPCLHFIQMQRGFDCGLMVTASHNPKEYHGFKLFDSSGGSISLSKGLGRVKELVEAMDEGGGAGSLPPDEPGLIDDYVSFLVKQAEGETLASIIAIDVSNGSAGMEEELVFSRLGLDAKILNKEADGSFPAHGPNPLEPQSREFISKKVRELRADFGVVLDGDGDRVIFADEEGNIIENYFISALFSEELLGRSPGEAIVYDLISSRVLPERIRELGGKPVVSRVGYTFLYDKMVSERALFGAEASGHVYFRVSDSFYTESATYAILLLLKVLKTKGGKLSTLVAPLKARYYQAPEHNLHIADKDAALAKIEREFSGSKIEKLDGISIDGLDFWFNVRPSNTEPLLRIRLEARSKAHADSALERIMGLLRE